MSDEITVSKHAYKRMKERCGWNKSAALRMAHRAYEKGIKYSDVTGRLRRYIDSEHYRTEANADIRLYGYFVFVYCGNHLITVYGVPPHLRTLVH